MLVKIIKKYSDETERIEEVDFEGLEKIVSNGSLNGSIEFDRFKWVAKDYLKSCFQKEPSLIEIIICENIVHLWEACHIDNEGEEIYTTQGIDLIISQTRDNPIEANGDDGSGLFFEYYSEKWIDYTNGTSGSINELFDEEGF
jgi:hypothetical protein